MPGGWEWLILLLVVVMLFGAKRLPEMAKAVGQSARVFKGEMKGMKAEADGTEATGTDAGPAKPTDQALPPGAGVAEQRGGHTNGNR